MIKLISQTNVAESIPFDNSTNGFTSDNAQGAIEEVKSSASPGFSFGKSGNSPSGTWLQCETVPSNVVGRYIYINSPVIKKVFLGNETSTSYTVSVYQHDGNLVNQTLLGSVVVSGSLGAVFSVNWAATTGKYLGLYISAGSVKNVVAGLELAGSS